MQALEFYFDEDAEAAVRGLRQRLEQAGVPSLTGRPHLTFAIASSIPARPRKELREDLGRLSLPAIWLYTLSTFPTTQNALFLGAVTDTELLAVHSAVHDALAGAVRDPRAFYLPGAWVPHCALAQDVTAEQLVAGFAALHPITPIRAELAEVGITDTKTGETELLL
jgi:2'-5' RNA ligase